MGKNQKREEWQQRWILSHQWSSTCTWTKATFHGYQLSLRSSNGLPVNPLLPLKLIWSSHHFICYHLSNQKCRHVMKCCTLWERSLQNVFLQIIFEGLSWLCLIYRDEQILAKSGKDAVQYLSFQRHMVVYLMIVCVISIAIVLPINFQGTLEGGPKEFGHTTMANLDPQWVAKPIPQPSLYLKSKLNPQSIYNSYLNFWSCPYAYFLAKITLRLRLAE